MNDLDPQAEFLAWRALQKRVAEAEGVWHVCLRGGHVHYELMCVGNVEIYLEPRPSYCDRGRYVAKLDVRGIAPVHVDEHDGWPRYYFDLVRGKAEIAAWCQARGFLVEGRSE